MTTHSWAYRPTHPAYRTAWPTLVGDTRRIIDHVRALGVVVAGPDGRRAPRLDVADAVSFNGDATTDLAGAPFTLLAPRPDHPRRPATAAGSVTTNRKPYELAVTAVLLRAVLLMPEAFAVASDLSWTQWGHGCATWPPAATHVSPRRIVAELFDAAPPVSPLRESITAARFAEPLPPRPGRVFEVGQAVHVYAYGNWRAGTVTKLGRTRVTVAYVRNADGQLDERPFSTMAVYATDGVALVAVDELGSGDVVIGVDGQTRIVETVRPGGRLERVVCYTDTSRATVPTQTVLRVHT